MKGYYFKRSADGQMIVGSAGDYLSSNAIGIIGDPNPKYKLSGISTLTYNLSVLNSGRLFTWWRYLFFNSPVITGPWCNKDTEFDRAAPFILRGKEDGKTPNDMQISATQGYFNNVFGQIRRAF